MNKVIYFLGAFFWFGGLFANAQEPDYETLFNRTTTKENKALRIYATVMPYYSTIRRDQTRIGNPNLAAEVGISYKRMFGVGFSGQTIGNYIGLVKNGSITQNGTVTNGDSPVIMQMAGGVFSYTNNPGKMTHAYARLFVGGLYCSEYDISSTSLFNGSFLNPNLGIECNLLPYLTFRTELGYRFASTLNAEANSKNVKLSGFIGGISLKIGNVR
ncbi:hypothetical protein MCERE19_03962 [Spirosomataceae bacterium]|jgi:hypothetical protein